MQTSQTSYEENAQENFLESENIETDEEALSDEIFEVESTSDDSDIEDLKADSETDNKDTPEGSQVPKESQIDEGETSAETELEALRAEVQKLKAEIENTKRLETELLDFTEVFPEQDIRTIPDEVWQNVRKGNSLAAAFALFERKKAHLEAKATEVNQINAYRSSGRAGSDTASEFFSPDDVRAMSQSEVRANYSRIIESMKKWN